MKNERISKTSSLLAIGLVSSLLLATGSAADAQTTSPWPCNHQVSGDWNYGTSAYGCDVSIFQTAQSTRDHYGPVLYRDINAGAAERQRYMSKMYPAMRDLGTYYIKRRNPSASDAEITGFLQGFFTLLRQETVWSHYRAGTDSIVRYLRADIGMRSHGIMQIYDGHHAVDVASGKGSDLVGNVVYGLDIYYRGWQASKTAACVSSPTDWKARARSAWAAYNGGSASLCRWTDPSSKYAHHDLGYLKNYEERNWLTLVNDPTALSPIDTTCLAEGPRPCPLPSVPGPTLYKISTGAYCVAKVSTLECMHSLRDTECMAAAQGEKFGSPVAMDPERQKTFTRVMLDRHTYCGTAIKGLRKVTSVFSLLRDTSLTTVVGGSRIATLPKGGVYQVMDFQVSSGERQSRYYKIKTASGEGWIYGGSLTDYSSYTAVAAPSSLPAAHGIPHFAAIGQVVKVLNSVGINLRKTIGGTILIRVPVNALLKVDGLAVAGRDNALYYKVAYGGHYGYVITGHLIPSNTIPSWTVKR